MGYLKLLFLLCVLSIQVSCTTTSEKMSKGENSLVSTTKSIEINAPIAVVWKIHADINSWSEWHPDMARSELESSLTVGEVFEWKSSGVSIKSKLTTVEEERKLSWSGEGFGATANHIWEFERISEDRTRVTTHEDMDGWFVWMFTGMMNSKVNESLEKWLSALKKKAES